MLEGLHEVAPLTVDGKKNKPFNLTADGYLLGRLTVNCSGLRLQHDCKA